ncbi:hypothetical protein ACOCEA_09550 [Maribacter sp. CXY002]|uniref:hypothetical protein n=1 Tax=Maribacter luteocoastalis TaxID=3407671 RepID=UPI003B6831E6
MSKPRKFKFSGRIPEDDTRHLLKAQVTDESIIPPHYVHITGVGDIAQYAPTVFGKYNGYNPPTDCDGYFMSAKFQPNNNCYAYGCVITSNSFPQPGRINGYLLPANFTGQDVVKGATMDGLKDVGASLEQLKTHQESNANAGHYVALLISPTDATNGWPGDYHWVRCDDIQLSTWSQKDGGDQVTNFDFAGEPIINPQTANWKVNQGPISKSNPSELVVSYDFYTYMFVPSTGVNII